MRRINLLHAHGSPGDHLYAHHGCRCVACRGEHVERGAAYYAAHREERAAYRAAYRATHREERAEYDRKYRAEHPEEIADKKRKYRAEHKDETAATLCKYREKHREEFAVWERNRRALEANATGTHTAADVRAQYERQHGKCFWRDVNPACAVNLKGGYHADHVIPLGGNRTSSNGTENIVLACPMCNGSKHAKDPMDWAGVMF